MGGPPLLDVGSLTVGIDGMDNIYRSAEAPIGFA
jgi:hypothetical protein